MSDSTPSTPSSVPSPGPKRGLLRRLFRTPLGLVGVVFALLAALVLAAPWAAERLAPGIASDWFAKHYRGRLFIEKLDLGWRGPQTIEGIELQDPSGARVARISVRLPGLWALARSGGKRFGKIEALGEATLHADASGVTNLDRALEPIEAASPDKAAGEPDSVSSAALSDYDAELDLRMTRIWWADEHTRALGAPFTLEDLNLSAAVHSGQPLKARLRATLAGSAKGSLSVDALVEHPFDPPSSATPPSAEISAAVEHLPTALLDALARQGDRVQALLGPELSLHVNASGTLDKGRVELRLDAPLGEVRGSAQLDHGVLRSQDQGLVAAFDVRRPFVESLTRPLLDAGTRLERLTPAAVAGANPADASLRFVLDTFELPLGAYLESVAKGDPQAGLAALLQGLRAQFSAELGDWSCTGETALGSAGPLYVRALRMSGALNAPDQDSVLTLEFLARSGGLAATTTGYGRTRVQLSVPKGASLGLLTPSEALAPLRLQAQLEDVPSALFDSFAQTGGDLAHMLGARVALNANVVFSLVAADPQAKPLTWSDVASRWREPAARASLIGNFDLRGTPSAEPVGLLGGERLAVSHLALEAKLAPGTPLDLHAKANFESKSPGHFDLQVSLGDLLADPATKTPLRFSMAANAAGLPTAVADALAQRGQDLQQLLGPLLALDATAQGTLDSGIVRVDLTGESSQVLLSGRLNNGVFSSADEPALRVLLQPDTQWLESRAQSFLPQGARLAFGEDRGVVALNVSSLSLPVSALIEALSKPGDELVRVALEKTRAEITLLAREFVFEDQPLLASGQRIDQAVLQVALSLRPGDPSSPGSLDCSLSSPSLGQKPVELHGLVPNLPDLLAITSGGNFAPIGLRLEAVQLPTGILDAYAGGMLREALGPLLDLTLDTRLAQVQDAPFSADTTLSLAAASGQSTLIFKAQVRDPFNAQAKAPALKRAEGALPELEAMLDVSGAGALLAFAPANARDLLRELCGESIAARIKLAQSSPGSAQANLSLDAGALQLGGAADYTEQVLTTKADQPLVLRILPSAALLQRLTAGQLPAGASVELARPDEALVLQIEGLRAELGNYFAADPALALAELVEHLDAKLDVTLPAFSYTHPPAAAGAQASRVQLRDLRLKASLQAKDSASLDLDGAVDASVPGQLSAHVVIEKPAGFLAKPIAPGSSATLEATLEHFPSGLLDVLAQQDGLLVDVLGPELAAKLSGAYPTGAGQPMRAEMHSNLGEVRLVSRFEDGAIVTQGEQGLDAKLGLTPLFTKRIVGSLLPMIVQVRQDDPTKRALITGRKLELPLNADLSKLSGEIQLDLGAVDYQLLPGLDQAFAIAGAKSPTMKNTVIRPITIKISQGIARYDDLPIVVAGHDLHFRGSTDLAKQSFELACSVPLELLGSKVESQLEALRNVLDPKLAVPLEIYGTWSSPRVRLGKGFLEKTLKGAAEGALKGELEKGLGGLLGGKKKKPKDG